MTEKDVLNLIEKDKWMMEVLRYAETLNLPDWMISAGFVRNKVWDELNGKSAEHSTDIDLIYFDPSGNDERQDEELTKKLSTETGWKWEVVNQIYTHDWNTEKPYTSTEDALRHFPETATAVAVKLENSTLKLVAPCGVEDLVNIVVRPTPAFMVSEAKRNRVKQRTEEKKWLEKWPKLTQTPF